MNTFLLRTSSHPHYLLPRQRRPCSPGADNNTVHNRSFSVTYTYAGCFSSPYAGSLAAGLIESPANIDRHPAESPATADQSLRLTLLYFAARSERYYIAARELQIHSACSSVSAALCHLSC